MKNRPLAAERAKFLDRLDQWVADGLVGHYAVILGDEISIFSTAKEAFETASERYGDKPFFMAPILPKDATNTTFFGKHG